MSHTKKTAAKSRPCATCPWRKSNWGRDDTPHPEYYDDFAREAIWSNSDGLLFPPGIGGRFGNSVICHVGYSQPGKPDADTSPECSGVLVLQQREVLRYHKYGDAALYPHNTHGLTRIAVLEVAGEMIGNPDLTLPQLRSLKREQLLQAAHVAINDEDIAHDSLTANSICAGKSDGGHPNEA